MQFMGYKRSEERAGIRNHVLILPTCACGSESSRIVASQVRGAVNIVFNTGCSDVAANTAMSQKILTGFACNPNSDFLRSGFSLNFESLHCKCSI